jgi:hypothetical protein
VLKVKDSGLTLIAREFYNTVRDLAPDKNKPDTINDLFMVFHEAGFIYRTRVKIKEDEESNSIKK